MLIVLTTLSIILPNYTSSAPGGLYSTSQLAFISVAIIALYGVFLFTQTVIHRDYFTGQREAPDTATPIEGKLIKSMFLLCVALAAVVLLAKLFAIEINAGVAAVGAPPSVSGVIIALIVLMPELISAVNSASRDNLQKSLNLALGSSLATIGLTIPAIAAANIFLQKPLVLGLRATRHQFGDNDARRQHPDVRDRADKRAFWLPASRDFRDFFVPGLRALTKAGTGNR